MAQPGSRYERVGSATVTVGDGTGGTRTVRYLLRRFLPQPGPLPTLTEHTVTRGDRLDLIAATYLGDPTQFWRICDGATVLHPDELTDDSMTGRVVRIPVPQP